MVIIEKIIYPSNKFALGAYLVMLSILAILAFTGVGSTPHVLCVGLGFIMGWTGHLLFTHYYQPVPEHDEELLTLEQTLAYARKQLDQTRSI